LYDAKKNINIDLTRLNKPSGGYQVPNNEYKFILNVCGPLTDLAAKYPSALDTRQATELAKTSAIQLKPSDPNFFKSIGQYLKSKLSYSNGQVSMLLDNGDLCGTKLSRKTLIQFKCGETNNISFLYEADCVYYFEWTTQYACIRDCSLEFKNSLYDLSKLTRPVGEFWSVSNLLNTTSHVPYTNIILNVCDFLSLDRTTVDPVLKSFHEKCSGKASICAFSKKTGQVTNLGVYNEDLKIGDDGSTLKLVYKDGACRTVLNFVCDLGVDNYPGFNKPQLTYVSSDGCLREIYWRTSEACPKNRLVATNECVIKTNSGRVLFDLSAMADENKAFFLAKHNHDLDEATDLSDFNSLFVTFKFHICGKRVPGTDFTFLDDVPLFQFTETPKLIYDQGLLYFKYENSTAKRYAIIKMECSVEESLSSNSQDYFLMQHLFRSLVRDRDPSEMSSSIAFILWKTRHACLSGSGNQLAAHFKDYIAYDDSDEHGSESDYTDSTERCVVYYESERNGLVDLSEPVKVNNYIDLRVLLKKLHADENDLVFAVRNVKLVNEKASFFKFHTRLCTPALKCKQSFGCLVLDSDSERSVSLGSKLNETRFSSSSGELVLDYVNGDLCKSRLGVNYSFELTIKCWSKDQPLVFVRSSQSGCKLHFEWLTRGLCPCELTSNGGQCATSAVANLNRLGSKIYPVTLNETKKIDLFIGNGSNLVFINGLMSSTSASRDQEGCTDRVEFYCDFNEERVQLEYLYTMGTRCERVIGFYTYLACPKYLTRANVDFKCNGLDGENLLVKLRIQNYQLVFRICGLLPNAVAASSLTGDADYGNCFDKYGRLFFIF
jgi:hypothetical protein